MTPRAASSESGVGIELRPMAAKAETRVANLDPKLKPVAHESEVKVGKENIDLN
jgi:hypothetical protein